MLAWNLDRVGSGGGIEGEDIVVHEGPMADAPVWLRQREAEGLLLAAKVYTGLYFATERWRPQTK